MHVYEPDEPTSVYARRHLPGHPPAPGPFEISLDLDKLTPSKQLKSQRHVSTGTQKGSASAESAPFDLHSDQ